MPLTVNGRRREDALADNLLLLDYLREVAGLTGTKRGCDGGECGACTVLVEDQPVLACLTLAARCEGKRIETIEALAAGGRLSRLQQAFHEQLGTQCGYCTPGFVVSMRAAFDKNPNATPAEIEEALSGNICRCGTYSQMRDAIASLCQAKKGGN